MRFFFIYKLIWICISVCGAFLCDTSLPMINTVVEATGGGLLEIGSPAASVGELLGPDPEQSEIRFRSFDETVFLEEWESHSDMPKAASLDEAGPSQPSEAIPPHGPEWTLSYERFCNRLETYLQKYSGRSDVLAQYPQLLGADLKHLAQEMATRFFDVDFLSTSEIDDLTSDHFRTYTKAKSSLSSFLADYYGP